MHHAPEADWAGSVRDALAWLERCRYDTIFADVALPDQQSGYRFARLLRTQHAITVPIYLMCDQPDPPAIAYARRCGATQLIARNGSAMMAALYGASVEDAFAEAGRPAWVGAVIDVARLFLASEAERIVQRKLQGLRLRLGTMPPAAPLIAAVRDTLDDEGDRTKFTRLAMEAIR
jgi:DNA-binding NarL/FixJ family response regulator